MQRGPAFARQALSSGALGYVISRRSGVDLHGDVLGGGVLRDVRQRLLDQPVDGRLELGGEPPIAERRVGQVQPTVDVDAVGHLVVLPERLDGGS